MQAATEAVVCLARDPEKWTGQGDDQADDQADSQTDSQLTAAPQAISSHADEDEKLQLHRLYVHTSGSIQRDTPHPFEVRSKVEPEGKKRTGANGATNRPTTGAPAAVFSQRGRSSDAEEQTPLRHLILLVQTAFQTGVPEPNVWSS